MSRIYLNIIIYSFASMPDNIAFKGIAGPVSNALYISYSMNAYTHMTIRRMNSDGTQGWIVQYQASNKFESINIDSTESKLYTLFYISQDHHVSIFQPSDGTVLLTHY